MKPRKKKPPVERVLARTIKSSTCWMFWGGVDAGGYGVIGSSRGWKTNANGKITVYIERAHRVVYEALRGPIPEGLELDHLCRQRRCVNPDHLEPVHPDENKRRSTRTNYGKTHCVRCKTALTPENLNTQGHCRECERRRAFKNKLRRRG